MPPIGAIIGLSVTLRGAITLKDTQFETDIRRAAKAAQQKSDELYCYYTTMRPPALGAQPSDFQNCVALKYRTFNEELNQDIWGWVCYTRPLTLQEVQDYELLPDENNPVHYVQYGLIRKTMKTDANGKRVIMQERVLDKTGKPYITSYPRKAMALMQELNERALDDNDGDTVTAIRVLKIAPEA